MEVLQLSAQSSSADLHALQTHLNRKATDMCLPTPSSTWPRWNRCEKAKTFNVQYPDPRESKNRTPNSELQYSCGVDYRSRRWIYLLDAPRGLGIRASGCLCAGASLPAAQACPAFIACPLTTLGSSGGNWSLGILLKLAGWYTEKTILVHMYMYNMTYMHISHA